eukprot:RCo001334
MAEVLEVHNAVVRSLIARHSGYEVKTIGDSFFVAFSELLNAVRFATQLQLELLHVSWPESLLAERDGSRLLDDDGVVLWCGLRVRVGIHVGSARVEVDPETLRADYFGPAVNFAARVESKALGGQVLLSEAALSLLDEQARVEVVLAEVGLYAFKGIEGTQTLYSVCDAALRGRSFPAEAQLLLCNRCKGPAVCPLCDGDDS